MQGIPRPSTVYYPSKSLSGPSCQEKPVYEAPTKKHGRMNAMGRVMGGSYPKTVRMWGYCGDDAELEKVAWGMLVLDMGSIGDLH